MKWEKGFNAHLPLKDDDELPRSGVEDDQKEGTELLKLVTMKNWMLYLKRMEKTVEQLQWKNLQNQLASQMELYYQMA